MTEKEKQGRVVRERNRDLAGDHKLQRFCSISEVDGATELRETEGAHVLVRLDDLDLDLGVLEHSGATGQLLPGLHRLKVTETRGVIVLWCETTKARV